MSKFEVINSGLGSAQGHMLRDAELLRSLTPFSPSYLHHYEWAADSLTYGYFIKPEQLLNLEQVSRDGIQMARRPTGGGLLFHLSDLAFSVLVPASHPWYSVNPLQNYAVINQVVLQTVEQWIGAKLAIQLASEERNEGRSSFCMAHTTRYDLVFQGRKIGGAAQRRTCDGLLHQASLCLAPPPLERIKHLLRDGDAVAAAMQRTSYPLLGSSCSDKDLQAARTELRALLCRSLKQVLTI